MLNKIDWFKLGLRLSFWNLSAGFALYAITALSVHFSSIATTAMLLTYLSVFLLVATLITLSIGWYNKEKRDYKLWLSLMITGILVVGFIVRYFNNLY
ncbi:MAG: hypothetical protein WBA16_05785 [Nonlabens sp.]